MINDKHHRVIRILLIKKFAKLKLLENQLNGKHIEISA